MIYKKKILFQSIKNYKYIIKKFGNFFFINLKNKLISQKNDKKTLEIFNFFFPDLKKDNKVAIQQIILKNLLNDNFNIKFLESLKSFDNINIPLDYKYTKFINKKYKIKNSLLSVFSWRFFLIIFFTKSLLKGMIILIRSLRYIRKKTNTDDSFFLADLNFKNFNFIKSLQNEKNIFTDLIKIFKKKYLFYTNTKENNYHFKKFSILNNYTPAGTSLGFLLLLKFLFILLISPFFFLYLLIFNHWQIILCSEEFFNYFLVKNQNKKKLFKNYLYSSKLFFFKPFYVYYLENNKIPAYYYFFSSNTYAYDKDIFKRDFWNLLNWKNYLIWNNHTLNFLKLKSKNKFNYKYCDIIDFESSPKKFTFNKKYFAIFDETPYSIFHKSFQDTAINWDDNNYIRIVLNQANLLARNYKINFIFKTKREHNFIPKKILLKQKIFSKYYQNLHKNNLYKNINFINPNINASKIINNKNCMGVISFCFASTAHIAKYYNKDTIYYLPININNLNKKALGQIILVDNYKDLKKWLIKIMHKNK